MPDFYIEKVSAKGAGKQTSSIDLVPGLNIICGPSDTGKSYVLEILDYLFGSDQVPVDTKHGYDVFEMVIKTGKGSITVTRNVSDGAKVPTLEVSSTDERIPRGTYKAKGGKLNINEDLWLKIMGIDERHEIVSNQKGDLQKLTIRSLLHTMLIKEERVIQRESILLPNYRATAYISGLYFLMTGEDFGEITPRVQKALKEARKQAVISYIQSRLTGIGERKRELNTRSDGITLDEIELRTREIIDEIQRTESSITLAIRESKQLMQEIYEANDQITECEHLLDRQRALKTQYASDIRRLGFVVDGDLKLEGIPKLQQCPLCHKVIDAEDNPGYREASEAEFASIKLRIKDVLVSEKEISQEMVSLQERLQDLMARRQKVEDLIQDKLKPRLEDLTQALRMFRHGVEIEKERALLEQDETTLKAELFQKENEETESDAAFDIKTYFTPEIMNSIDNVLSAMLRECKFDSFGSVRFNVRGAFDIVIDGKAKRSYGKGYRAFLNTILSLAVMKYLAEHGKFNTGLLAVDSPILSLKEPGEEKASDTMKASLFSYLVNHQGYGQLIILENDIPEVDYKGANIIRFTKDSNVGRAGLLYEPK